jgi:hypothetical protein
MIGQYPVPQLPRLIAFLHKAAPARFEFLHASFSPHCIGTGDAATTMCIRLAIRCTALRHIGPTNGQTAAVIETYKRAGQWRDQLA